MISHTEAVNRALLKASELGCLVKRNEVGMFYDQRGNPRRIGVVGWPDIDGFLPDGARGLAMEIKTGSATRTIDQKRWASAFQKRGGLYIIPRYDDTRGLDGDDLIEREIRDALSGFRKDLFDG